MIRFAFIFLLMVGCGRHVEVPPEPIQPEPTPIPSPDKPRTIVMVWGAPWCPYCHQDIPVLAAELKRLDPDREKVEFKIYVPTGARAGERPSDKVTHKYVTEELKLSATFAYSDPWQWTMFNKYVGGLPSIPAAAVILPDGKVKAYRSGATFDPKEIAAFATK